MNRTKLLAITILPIFLGLITLQTSSAYQPDASIKIAAPSKVPVTLLMGYDSRRGEYKETCVKMVKGSFNKRTQLGADERSDSTFKLVNSVSELTENRSLSVATSAKANFGVWSAAASVDMNFEERFKEETNSTLVQIHFEDLEAPIYTNFNAKYVFNERGKKAFKALTKGRKNKFLSECGDSVVVGKGYGRTMDAVGTASIKKTLSSRDRSLKTAAAGRYMLIKMGAEVAVSDEKVELDKDTEIQIHYALSGNARVAAPTNLKQLKRTYREFTAAENNTSSLLHLYHVPIFQVVEDAYDELALSKRQRNQIHAIIRGISVLESARNDAYLDILAAKERNRLRTVAAQAKTDLTDGIYFPQLEDVDKYRRAHAALSREHRLLVGKARRLKGCTAFFGRECKSLYARLQQFKEVSTGVGTNTGKTRWYSQFLKNAYESPKACEKGYPISNPNGTRRCQKCAPGKEPRFDGSKQGKCDYIVERKKAKNNIRLFAQDLILKENKNGKAAQYPAYCIGKNKGCGQAAANRICKSKGHGEAVEFAAWDWRPSNSIHHKKYRVIMANGKACKEKGGDASTPVTCHMFKAIECATAKKTVKKQKNPNKLKGA